MKRILSVFDDSGNWPHAFAENGYDVWLWDLKKGLDVLFFDSVETTLETVEYCDGLLFAPDCRDFTSSGAQYWGLKDKKGITRTSLELVRASMRLADLFYPTDLDYDGTFFWCLENPAGRLPTLIPDLGRAWYFDPCDFAGYLQLTDSDHNELDRIRRKDGIDVSAEENEIVLRCNAYTKHTGLWGVFNRDMKKMRVEPVKTCPQGSPMQRLGGKSEKTKEERSITPMGFSIAFYQHHCDWRPEEW